MYAASACSSSSAGNRQKASVSGLTLLQPCSEMLRKHLGTPVPGLRHLGNSRCIPLINQLWKQQGPGDVQLITRVTSSAQSKLRQKEGIRQVPLAESSATNETRAIIFQQLYSLLLIACGHISWVALARQGSSPRGDPTGVAGRQKVLPQWKRLGFGVSPVRKAKSEYAVSYQGFNGQQILS